MLDERKKARPDADTSGQAMREHTLESVNSREQYNSPSGSGQGSIASLLMAGRENGLHLSELVQITGWTERDVRKSIHRERRNGCPICSNNRDGYYLPGSEAERASCVRSLRHRASEILKAAASIERN